MYCKKTKNILRNFPILDRNNKWFISCMIFFAIFVLILTNHGIGQCMGWPDVKTRLLPDGAFAVIEPKVGAPIRHCPHHDLHGNLDTEQMIYVLGALDTETWLNPKNKITAETHLQKHYDRFKTKAMKKGLSAPANINEANLADLVLLPQIGPVLAVKIAEYRNTRNLFVTIEDIKKVEGIGQGTFNAIRYYIRID